MDDLRNERNVKWYVNFNIFKYKWYEWSKVRIFNLWANINNFFKKQFQNWITKKVIGGQGTMCNKVLLIFFHPRGFLSDSISCIFLEEVSESHIVSPLSPQKRNEILWFDNRFVFLYFLDLTTRRIDLEIETFLKFPLNLIFREF